MKTGLDLVALILGWSAVAVGLFVIFGLLLWRWDELRQEKHRKPATPFSVE